MWAPIFIVIWALLVISIETRRINKERERVRK
jgi:hypothetical protein